MRITPRLRGLLEARKSGKASRSELIRKIDKVRDHIASVVPSELMPKTDSSRTKKWCGSFGCVFETGDPDVVCKVTIDPTESVIAQKYLGKTVEALPRYFHFTSVPDRKYENLWFYWREKASLVGDRKEMFWTLKNETKSPFPFRENNDVIVFDAIKQQYDRISTKYETMLTSGDDNVASWFEDKKTLQIYHNCIEHGLTIDGEHSISDVPLVFDSKNFIENVNQYLSGIDWNWFYDERMNAAQILVQLDVLRTALGQIIKVNVREARKLPEGENERVYAGALLMRSLAPGLLARIGDGVLFSDLRIPNVGLVRRGDRHEVVITDAGQSMILPWG